MHLRVQEQAPATTPSPAAHISLTYLQLYFSSCSILPRYPLILRDNPDRDPDRTHCHLSVCTCGAARAPPCGWFPGIQLAYL